MSSTESYNALSIELIDIQGNISEICDKKVTPFEENKCKATYYSNTEQRQKVGLADYVQIKLKTKRNSEFKHYLISEGLLKKINNNNQLFRVIDPHYERESTIYLDLFTFGHHKSLGWGLAFNIYNNEEGLYIIKSATNLNSRFWCNLPQVPGFSGSPVLICNIALIEVLNYLTI